MVESSIMLELLIIIKKYVEKGIIDIEKVNFDLLLNNEEKVFNDIIKVSDTNKKIALIYLYSNETFMSDENKHKKSLIAYFKTAELECFSVKKGIEVATNKDVLKREDAKEIISLITNAKGDDQAHYGYFTATDEGVLARADAKEVISLITNAKGDDQTFYGCCTATDKGVLAREDAKEIISLIINAKGEDQAHYGSRVARNAKVLTREDAKEIISLITNAKGGSQADYGSTVARNEDVLKREDAKEIISLIINAKGDNQADYMEFISGLEHNSHETINSFVKKGNFQK